MEQAPKFIHSTAKNMNQAYYPASNKKAVLWLTNYKMQIANEGAGLGLNTTEIQNEQNYCQEIIDGIIDIDAKLMAYKSAVKHLQTIENTTLKKLKKRIANHKHMPTFTKGIGEILHINGIKPMFNPITFKPQISAKMIGGKVQLKFKKKGVEGINIYHRLHGNPTWKFLAHASKSPYHVPIQLQTPGQAEHWEFQVYGVINDENIGILSNIAEVLISK